METSIKNEKRMDKQCEIELKEQQIYDFVSKLETKEYKVILYNGQIPILKDDLILVELTINRLNEYSTVELKGDIMVIHTDTKTIEFKGYKDMSDGEIFARQYLDTCERESLIIKDNLEQVELREDNYIKDIMSYYNKCKDIVNIRTVAEDSENYLMNWDCIIVEFIGLEKEEIWQPC